jgi:hypothetical protein
MVKIGNPRPAVQPQGPPPKPNVDLTELARAVRADFKRRNGGKSPPSGSGSDDEEDDDVWSQSSNKYKQGYTAYDLRVPISSTILPQ